MTTPAMDWDDPAQRAALIDQVGPVEYARLQRVHLAESVVDVVNGYLIRVHTVSPFGRIYVVDGLGQGTNDLDAARALAAAADPQPINEA